MHLLNISLICICFNLLSLARGAESIPTDLDPHKTKVLSKENDIRAGVENNTSQEDAELIQKALDNNKFTTEEIKDLEQKLSFSSRHRKIPLYFISGTSFSLDFLFKPLGSLSVPLTTIILASSYFSYDLSKSYLTPFFIGTIYAKTIAEKMAIYGISTLNTKKEDEKYYEFLRDYLAHIDQTNQSLKILQYMSVAWKFPRHLGRFLNNT